VLQARAGQVAAPQAGASRVCGEVRESKIAVPCRAVPCRAVPCRFCARAGARQMTVFPSLKHSGCGKRRWPVLRVGMLIVFLLP